MVELCGKGWMGYFVERREVVAWDGVWVAARVCVLYFQVAISSRLVSIVDAESKDNGVELVLAQIEELVLEYAL